MEHTSQEPTYLVRRELRSPRSAAIAGIVFSLLMMTIMVLSSRMAAVEPGVISKEWLEGWSDSVFVVITLTPFTGIAFLWFTGVIRDWLGHNEDRFFATIFFGSGIMFVLLLFIWAAVFGAMMGAFALATDGLADDDIYVFGAALMNEIVANYALRMAGVFMMAIATLWNRTGHVPRWLIISTYILAVSFLVAANWLREARFIFPIWVLVVSVRILVLNYRRESDAPAAT